MDQDDDGGFLLDFGVDDEGLERAVAVSEGDVLVVSRGGIEAGFGPVLRVGRGGEQRGEEGRGEEVQAGVAEG